MSGNNRNRRDSRFDQNWENSGEKYDRSFDRNSGYNGNDSGNQGNNRNADRYGQSNPGYDNNEYRGHGREDWHSDSSQNNRNLNFNNEAGYNDYNRNYYNSGNDQHQRDDFQRFSFRDGRQGSSRSFETDNSRRFDRDDMNRRNDEERGFWDRTKDEVSSWFGDDDAERRRRMDKQQGEFRGHGPKGYRRSDDRIREDVNDRLSDDTWINASDIEVKVENGEVTLSGTVDSRNSKRHAEDIAESVSGVSNVENRIRVKQTSGMGMNVTGSDPAQGSANMQQTEKNGADHSKRTKTLMSHN